MRGGRFTFLIVVPIFCSVVHAGQDVVALSLEQACVLAFERNPSIRNEALEVTKQEWQRRETSGKLWPQVEGYSTFNNYYAIPTVQLPGEIFGSTGMIPVEFGTTYDWSTGFKATQILYNQSVFTALKVAKRTVEMAELSMQQKKEEVVYQVAQLYYLCLATEGQRALLEQSMHTMEKLLAITKAQSDNGIIRNADYLRVHVNELNLQTQMDNLERLYREQTGMLKYLIGLAVDTTVELIDTLRVDSVPAATESVPKVRTELQLLDMRRTMASLHLELVKVSYLPSLSVYAQHYYQAQRNAPDFFDNVSDNFIATGLIGLNLTVPIFNGFDTRARVHQATIDIEQMNLTYKSTQDFMVKEMSDAKRLSATSRNNLLRQRQAIEAAQRNYDAHLQGYRQSITTLSDLLSAQEGLTESRLSYLTALLQLNNAVLDERRAGGNLFVSLIH